MRDIQRENILKRPITGKCKYIQVSGVDISALSYRLVPCMLLLSHLNRLLCRISLYAYMEVTDGRVIRAGISVT